MALLNSTKLSEALARITELEGQVSTAIAAAGTFETKIAELNAAAIELSTAHTAAIAAKDAELLELNGKLEAANKDVETRVQAGIVEGISAAGVEAVTRDPKAADTDTKPTRDERVTGFARVMGAIRAQITAAN